MTDANDLRSRYGPWAVVTGAPAGIGADNIFNFFGKRVLSRRADTRLMGHFIGKAVSSRP